MDDITNELQGFATHCMESGQEQVADLQHRAIQKIEQLEAKLKEADYLIEELDSHEGAEGWSGYLRERLLEYTQSSQEKDDGSFSYS